MSLALGIRYLTGYSVAATRTCGEPEWPPHPARVYMALAAAHFETGGDLQERGALEWLESLEKQPALYASEADFRVAVTHFVPVNDKAVGKKPGLLQSVSGWPRSKQARTFPRVRPHDDRVFLVWDADCPAEHQKALESLCTKVTRLGHSSSLVQMWVADADEVPEPNWIPDDVAATQRTRKMFPGLLQYLEQQFGEGPRKEYEMLSHEIEILETERKNVKGRGSKQRKAELQEQIDGLKSKRPPEPPRDPLRPRIGVWQGYSRPAAAVNNELVGSVWDPGLLTLCLEPEETDFPRLDLVSALQVMQRMYESVLCRTDEMTGGQIPEFISGHRENGSASDKPHLAYLPIAFVGRQHADGHLMGIAVAIPDSLVLEERRLVWTVVREIKHLKLGRLGIWRLRLEDREFPPYNLRSETWTAPENGARQWATVTPVVFDRHPKTKDRAAFQREIAAMVARGCRRIELPEPREVIPTPVSAHQGVPTASEFPKLKRKDGSKRGHTHVIVIFDEPVRGPVSLCAGRYRGYGFCRPL